MESENSTEKKVVEEKFNNEIIWDNNRQLFDKYFRETFTKNRYYFALRDIEMDTFEKNVDRLKLGW